MSPWHLVWIIPLAAAAIGLAAVVNPETVHALAASVLIIAGFLVAHYRRERRRPDWRWWYSLAILALVERFAFSLVHLVIGFWVYGGRADFTGYHQTALDVGPKILTEPLGVLDSLFGPDIHRLFYGFLFLLTGPGIVGRFFMSGLVGFTGAYLFLRAYETTFGSIKDSRFLAVTLFFLPTLAFWAGILGKDSWVFLFLGWATWALAHISRGGDLRHWIALGLSLYLVTMLRPPAGTVMILVACATWVLSREGTGGAAAILRPVQVLW